MKRSILFSLTIFFITSTAVCEPYLGTPPLSGADLNRYQYCGDDKDCMVARNGCCDCANGGSDVAINKLRHDEFRSRFSCMSSVCTEMAAVPPCGSGTVSCVEHRCLYTSESDYEKQQP